MKINLRASSLVAILACLILGLSQASVSAQQGTIAPPALGEETKGAPAEPEQAPDEAAVEEQVVEKEKAKKSAFGTTKITESKRENGQVYLIELEHSLGSKQYIEEHDSDGKIQSTSNDIEETPNLPKWRIGSW